MEVYSYSISDFRSSLSRIWQGSTDKYGTVMKGTCRKCFLNDGYLSWGCRLLDVMNLEEPHFPFWKKSFLPGAKPDILIGYQTIFVFDLTRFSLEILPNSTFILVTLFRNTKMADRLHRSTTYNLWFHYPIGVEIGIQ